MRILVVEDDADVADAISGYLGRQGFACDVAEGHATALACLDVQRYALAILDIQLPDGDGRALLRDLGRRGAGTRVLMLSADFSVDVRVASLDGGADDYLVKPFELRELAARVRALIRRGGETDGPRIAVGDLVYDPSARSVRLAGAPVAMTRRELTVLDILLRNPGRIVSKDALFEGLFSFDDADVGLNAIELYVARLRKKIAGSTVRIRTERGLGYRLEAANDD